MSPRTAAGVRACKFGHKNPLLESQGMLRPRRAGNRLPGQI